MGTQGITFPAFIKAEYDPGKASNQFVADVDEMLANVDRRLGKFSDRAKQALENALKAPRTDLGGLDIGAGDFQAAARAQQARATAAREIATALERTAREENDYSLAMRQSIVAARELEKVETQRAADLTAQASIADRVAQRLASQASAVDQLTAANRRNAAANDNATRGIGAQRAAFINLGQQMQDATVQFQMGTHASTIFAQQLPQAAFALSGLAGNANKTLAAVGSVATFMSGPWGASILAGSVILGPFIGKLIDAASAADDVKFATSAMGDAQGILGQVLDLTTGKISNQSTALMALAQAQLLVAKVQAQTRAADARRGVASIQDRPVRFTGGGLGGGFTLGRRPVDARDSISQAVLDGTLDGKTAVQRLENLRRVGAITDQEFSNAATSVANLGVELENLKVYDKADKLLNGQGGTDLLKPKTGGRKKGGGAADKAAREAKSLADFADSAAESIKRLSERFDEQPRLIDQTSASARQLDAIIKDLSERKPIGWEQMVADANAAKGVIQDALMRPFEQLREESERRLEIERLLAAGRDDEAQALQTIWQFEKQNYDLKAAQKDEVLEIVRRERLVTEELQRRQEVMNYYLDATRSVKSELVALFSGQGSLDSIRKAWINLNSQVMVDKIFGPMFRDLDKWVKEQSGVTTSVDHFTTETERAAKAAGSVANSLLNTASRLASGGAPTASDAAFLASFDATFAKPGAANDNHRPGDAEVMPDGSLKVTATIKPSTESVMSLTPAKYFSEMTGRMTEALRASGLGEGPASLLSGALGGYMVGGKVGAGLGALSSVKGLGGQKGVFGKALGGIMDAGMYGPLLDQIFATNTQGTGGTIGAAAGALIPGVGPILGSIIGGSIGQGTGKTVGTLAGAAIGSIIPGVGTVIGALLGSLFGGLFHSAKYGNASFQNGALNVNTNSSSLKEGATSSGNDLLSSLTSITEALGATLGSFNVSLGQTDGKWRISTTGRTGELKSKYSDVKVFGEGEAAYKAALQAAIADAISDGAITGISQAAQNILKAGGDLQKAIEKAALIQSIPKMLKQMTDPVGYALDELNAEFKKMVDALKEGGASAAEFADAQKLYDLKRAEAIKQASEQMTGSLRSLYDQLTIGNDALSLRDRRAGALAIYNPLADRVAAGDRTAFDDYANAARTLMDIERQLNGSQGDYFAMLSSITDLTRNTLDSQQALIDAATASSSPFTDNAANNNQAVVDGLGDLGTKLDAVNQNLGLIINQGGLSRIIYADTGTIGYF